MFLGVKASNTAPDVRAADRGIFSVRAVSVSLYRGNAVLIEIHIVNEYSQAHAYMYTYTFSSILTPFLSVLYLTLSRSSRLCVSISQHILCDFE